jgi:hypothetical protein
MNSHACITPLVQLAAALAALPSSACALTDLPSLLSAVVLLYSSCTLPGYNYTRGYPCGLVEGRLAPPARAACATVVAAASPGAAAAAGGGG